MIVKSLGELIETNRHDKHMTVAELVAQADLSQATYNRMRRDHADIKLSATLGLLDALRLQVADVGPILKREFMTNETWQEQLATTAEKVVRHEADYTELADLRSELLTSRDPQLAQDLLGLYADLLLAKVKNHQSVASQVAQQLLEALSPYQLWTRFEYQLAITTINYLSWPQLQRMYRDFFQPLAPVATIEHLFDDAYLAMMATVLTHGQPTEIQEVARWWRQRRLLTNNFTFAIYRKFLPCCTAWLRGDHAQASQLWATLETALATFDGSDTTAYHRVLTRFWHLLQEVSTTCAICATRATAATGTTASTEALPSWLTHVRQAKMMPVEDLWHAMYLSKAAYYRQFNQLSSMKTAECFMALNSLRIESSDLDERVETIGLNVAATQRRLQDVIAQVSAQQQDPAVFTKWQTRLQATYEQTRNVGYRQLSEWLTVIQDEAAGKPMVAGVQAIRLYKDLIQYDNWTAFEYSLIVTVLPYLPFTQGQFLFTRYLASATRYPAQLAVATTQDLDLIYLGLLNSAIAEEDPAYVRQALTWIRTRWVSSRDVSFRIFQRVADQLLADTPDVDGYQHLMQQVQGVFGNQAQSVTFYLTNTWQQALHVLKGMTIA
ncbi:MAG: helix-turn-helix transcriptional regulator [Lactobacillus sp.]|jgi:transcriptional regulator with XRE-family HTH domain|nr:helix-turn-helix transcriptional regulator [Lactobacillus sp.]